MGTECDNIKRIYNRETPSELWQESNLPTGITAEDIFKCTGLCGPGKYINLDFTLDISDGSSEARCKACEAGDNDTRCSNKYWYSTQKAPNVLKTNYTWPDKEVWKKFNSEDISIKDDEGKKIDIVDEDLSKYSNNIVIEKCNELSNTEPEGFLQSVELELPEAIMSCDILYDYLETKQPLDDDEIRGLVCDNRYSFEDKGGNITKICQGDIIDLREAIHKNRGENVPISNHVLAIWKQNYNTIYEPESGEPEDLPGGYDKASLSSYTEGDTYSSKHIIQSEVIDYLDDIQQIDKNKNPTGISISGISNDLKLNTDFETCMSTVLDLEFSNRVYCDGKRYEDVEQEISRLKDLKDLQSCHLDYIEDRLRTIATLKIDDIDKCIRTYNLTETFNCDESFSNKTLKIAYLIFHLVGFDSIDMANIKEGTPDYDRIKVIINRLTPLIKPTIRKLVEISNYYEEKTCGKQSATTHMLNTMYEDFFDMNNDYTIELNKIDMMPDSIKEGNIETFSRTIIWMLSIAFFIYIILKAISLLG